MDVEQIHFIDNFINIFTKALPTSTFKKIMHATECNILSRFFFPKRYIMTIIDVY